MEHHKHLSISGCTKLVPERRIFRRFMPTNYKQYRKKHIDYQLTANFKKDNGISLPENQLHET
jgi:hypothetical protein